VTRLLPLIVCCVLLAACRPADVSTSAAAGGERVIPIAVVPFALMPGTPTPPVDVAEAIRTDLVASGRFAPTDVASMPARPSDPADIRFDDWRHLDVAYLVVGRVSLVHDGGHEVEYQVVDARAEATVFGCQVPSAPDALGTTASEIATFVGRRIDG
jgi:TolB protein